jgi:transposase
MYFDYTVDIPSDLSGGILKPHKNGTTYVHYTYGREYKKEKKYNIPKRTTIGKVDPSNPSKMFPNANFLKFFPEAELPDDEKEPTHSSCIRSGSYIVIKKIIEEYGLDTMVSDHLGESNKGLFLDLAAYSIIAEDNAGQYYPDYAYNHPLFTSGMHVYSDSKVSRFLNSITDDQRIHFLDEWNKNQDHRQKIYISYDSTNKSCQAGDIEMIEYGHNKIDDGKPIFNYAIAYDRNNREPLFYEDYPGSIVDISQLQYTLQKTKDYGYKNVGFILDRGYFSKENIHFMDKNGYGFIIMVKGMASFVSELVMDVKGTFEETRGNVVREYRVYGTTIKKKLYPSDEKDRYFHIYYSPSKNSAEREALESKIEKIAKKLKKLQGQKNVDFQQDVTHYYDPIVHDDGTFLYASEKKDVIERELKLCGYFCIVASDEPSAQTVYRLYKSRDGSEKLFRGDKSYLGDKALRVHGPESAEAKIFVEFVALILRNKIYTCLKDEMVKNDRPLNYMTVPAAIKELEKIELISIMNNPYCLDHAISKTQRTILKAFGIDNAYIKKAVLELGEELIGREP